MRRYHTFWRRVGARIIDTLVFAPLTGVVLFLSLRGLSYSAYLLLNFASMLLGAVYFIGLHYRYGQTWGKMATGVKVIRFDEQPLTFSDATTRYLPNLAAGLIYSFPVLWTLRHDGTVSLQSFVGVANPVGNAVNSLWILAQLIVIASNDKRRAIHDYLAETQVVVLKVEQSAL